MTLQVLGQLLRSAAVGTKKRRRLNAQDGRRSLLDAGRQVAYEEPIGEPLANIRLPEVAARADVTIGAFYHYWESQDDYRLDLLRHLLEPDRFDTWRAAGDVVEPLIDAGAALTEVIRQATEHNFEALCDLPDQRVSMALWAQDETESIHLLRSMYVALDDSWSDLYVAVLAHYGREPRPPFDGRTLAVALTALADGMLVRHGLEPRRVEAAMVGPTGPGGGDPQDWSLISCVVLALLPTVTRPIEGDESERADLWTTVDRLLLFCFHYDADARRYSLAAMNVMRAGGGLTALLLGFVLMVFWLRERRRGRKAAAVPAPESPAPSSGGTE